MMNGKVQEKKLCQTRKKKLLSFILNITLLNLTNNCEGRQRTFFIVISSPQTKKTTISGIGYIAGDVSVSWL
jgi:hypothetical protein